MISQPLKLADIITKPWKQLLSPEDLNQVEESSIPKVYFDIQGHQTNEHVTVSFLGDITNLEDESFSICDELKEKLSQSQYIIVNLESVVGKAKRFQWSKNFVSKSFIKELVESFPNQKIIFGLANNHSFDYGESGLNATIQAIEEYGAEYVGTAKKPFIYIEKNLRLDAQSLWHNDDHKQISKFVKSPILVQKDSVIKYFHWGELFEENPTEQQMLDVESLGEPLLVCGHHGHCPQPIQFVDSTLVAYSLGDFLSGYKLNAPENGILLQVKFSFSENKWGIAKSSWNFISHNNSSVEIEN